MNDGETLVYLIGSLCIAGSIGNMYSPSIGFLTFGSLMVSLGIISMLKRAITKSK